MLLLWGQVHERPAGLLTDDGYMRQMLVAAHEAQELEAADIRHHNILRSSEAQTKFCGQLRDVGDSLPAAYSIALPSGLAGMLLDLLSEGHPAPASRSPQSSLRECG